MKPPIAYGAFPLHGTVRHGSLLLRKDSQRQREILISDVYWQYPDEQQESSE